MHNKIVLAISGLLIFVIATLIVLIIAFSKAGELEMGPVKVEKYISKLNMQVGDNNFEIELENNETSQDFASRLPLTINMRELNGNEKYAHFSKGFASNPKRAGTIETGDFMLFSTDTVVVFYETFDTSYSYTRMGKVTNPEKLKEVLGSEDVSVTFSVIY